MGFVDAKLVNSDFLDEPINHLNYIESIERYGKNAYVFEDNDTSKRIFRNLISSSVLLFEDSTIRSTLIEKLKSDDLYYFFKNHGKLGQCLNLILGNSYFSNGDFNTVCEYMNMTAIRALNKEFLDAFSTVIKEHLDAEDALEWIKKRFNVDLSSYSDLGAAILDTEGWKLMIKSGPFMSCACTTKWFTDKVVEARHTRIWRTANRDYYTDDGKHYTKEGTADGKDIATDALKLLETQGIVTEEYLTIVDSAYQRLEDALLWFAQNNAISSLKGYPELINVFINNERCINYLIQYPDVLKEAFNDETFARALLGNTTVKAKLTADSNANAKVTELVTNLTTLDGQLRTISKSWEMLNTNASTLYRSDDVRAKVTALLTKVTNMDTIVNEVKAL